MNENGQNKYIEINVATELYAIPIEDIQEIIRYQEINRLPGSHPYLLGIINLRDKLIPVVSLGIMLGQSENPKTRASRIVILKWKDQLFGITVDQVTKVNTYDQIQRPPVDTGRRANSLLTGIGQSGKQIVGILHLASILEIIN